MRGAYGCPPLAAHHPCTVEPASSSRPPGSGADLDREGRCLMTDFHAAVELDATKATLLAHRQGLQFLECPRGLTARLGVIDQQVLPTAVGHAEPIAAQMNFANARVTHVDSAVEVTDIPMRPQLTETSAGG
jgi:hypothetical protein